MSTRWKGRDSFLCFRAPSEARENMVFSRFSAPMMRMRAAVFVYSEGAKTWFFPDFPRR